MANPTRCCETADFYGTGSPICFSSVRWIELRRPSPKARIPADTSLLTPLAPGAIRCTPRWGLERQRSRHLKTQGSGAQNTSAELLHSGMAV